MTKQRRRVWWDLLRSLSSVSLLPHRFRPALLRFAGVDVGEGAVIMPGLVISGYAPVIIGARAFVNYHVYIDAQDAVYIGSDAQVADHVRIVTSTHDVVIGSRVAGPLKSAPIRIGEGAWLGSGACLLSGVAIGAQTVVGAGALVTTTLDSGAIYVGVPARYVRSVHHTEGAPNQ